MINMQKGKLSTFLKYVSYVIEIILIYILFTTPRLIPEVFGGKPSLLIIIAISIAVFEREIPAMIFGLVCGLLTDVSYSTEIGVFSIGLTIICFILGYVANNIIVANIWNFLLVSFVSVSLLLFLHFVFAILIKGNEDPWNYFLMHYISRIVLTFIFTPVFYFLNRFIHRTLGEED